VEVDSGTLMLARSYSSTGGKFIVAAGAVLDLNSGGIYAGQYSGTYTGTGAGTLQMTGGQIGINSRAQSSIFRVTCSSGPAATSTLALRWIIKVPSRSRRCRH